MRRVTEQESVVEPAENATRRRLLLLSAALVVTLLGFWLRVHALGTHSFWVDELFTVWTSQKDVAEMLTVKDHPPLLYLVTSFSLNLFGESEFAARLPALYIGVLAVPLLIALGKALHRPTAGLWAALLLAVSPLHLHHSQEARHYPWLMAFSLLSYILLWRALRQPTRQRWFLYAVATALNLYTHYGALIVLATQVTIIIGWMLPAIIPGRGEGVWGRIRYPVGAAAIVLLLYVAWLPSLWAALRKNIGEEIVTGTGTVMPVGAWIAEAVDAFSLYPGKAAGLTLVVGVLGAAVWLWQGRRDDLLFAVIALVLPLILIPLTDVARGAHGRYIIYLLPFYLFFAGIMPSFLLQVACKRGPTLFALAATICLSTILAFAVPAVAQEYRAEDSDWRGILDYLDAEAQSDDLLVTISLNFPDGFSRASTAFPYYLKRHERTYRQLDATAIPLDEARALAKSQVAVWGIVGNWETQRRMFDLPLNVAYFDENLFVITAQEHDGTTLDQLLAIYQALLPLAKAPTPRCLLQQDVAVLYLAREQYLEAERELNRSRTLCPTLPTDAYEGLRQSIQSNVDEARLHVALDQGRQEEALMVAREILVWNPKHQLALKTLTTIDLMDRFHQGDVQLSPNGAPEEIRVERFMMPHNGDWGDVLLVHPPAAVSFDVSLPQQPVTFASRIALAPQSWNWGGDGATFIIQVRRDDGTVDEIYRQEIGNNPADRRWHPVELSLTPYGGQQIELILRTESGPANDGTGDWAGWETPRLLKSFPAQLPESQP